MNEVVLYVFRCLGTRFSGSFDQDDDAWSTKGQDVIIGVL